MNKTINIENFLREMRPKIKKFGFGISHTIYQELCERYNTTLINFVFPYYTTEEKVEIFHCTQLSSLEKMENDWKKISEYIDKVMEDISFMNITLEEYYPKIEFEFFQYQHFSKEDIIFTYNSTK